MADEKTTEEKIDAIIAALEANGKLAEQQAAALPACLAMVEPGEKWDLVLTTMHTLRRLWSRWPDVEPLVTHLCLLVERELVRRELSEGWEIGQLTKLAELPSCDPGEKSV